MALGDVTTVGGVELREEWRVVDGFDGYEVSSLGRVRSYRCRAHRHIRRQTPRILKPKTVWSGYLQVGLRDGYRKRFVSIHRLVAIAFHGPPPTYTHEVNHKDAVRSNNAVCNLEWVTKSQNKRDVHARGVAVGVDHWTHKSPHRVLRGDRWHSARTAR